MTSSRPKRPEYPNLRHIRLLDAAVRLGSLSSAANEVHISQPAASQAIGKLKLIYGADLLERRGNGVGPTREGEIVNRRGSRALDFMRDISLKVASKSHLSKGLVIDRLESHATIAQLRAISAFAETGSFGAAAAALGYTEPSVQRAAREIERIGGVPLFSCAHRTIQLTPEGRQIAARASLALNELDKASEELREYAGRFDGLLVIGTLPLVRTSILPVAVVRLAARYPEARIEIVDGSYEDLVHRLSIGGIDMLLGALRAAAVPMHLHEETLFTDSLCVVARSGHPIAKLAAPTVEDYRQYPWVLSRKDTPNRAVFDAFIGGEGADLDGKGYIETGSLVALRGILDKSDYLALLSRLQARYELEAGLLTQIAGPVAGSERPIGITTLPEWAPTALHAAFLEELRRSVAEVASD